MSLEFEKIFMYCVMFLKTNMAMKKLPIPFPAGTRRLHDVEKWSLFGHDVGDVVQTLD